MSNRIHRPFSNEYLRDYSREHLWYEVWMFFETGTMLPYGVSSPRHHSLENAVLESFAVHLRNLLDFFYPGKHKRPDDVLAEDYFEEKTLPANFPQKSAALDAAETRAHKQVSHLTTERLPGGDPGKLWDFVPLMEDMRERVLDFTDRASRARLHQGFIDQVNHILTKR